MARRTSHTHRSLTIVVLALAAATLAALWGSRPIAVTGLLLSHDLTVAEGSVLPSPDIDVGDAVVAVDGQPVSTRRAFTAALLRARGDSVPVTVEQRGRLRSLTLSAALLESEPPVALRSAERILRVDGVDAAPGLRPLDVERQVRAAAVPVTVEFEPERARLSGPLEVRRRPHEPIGLAWLGLVWAALLATASATARGPERRVSVSAFGVVGVGGLALATLASGLLSSAVHPALPLVGSVGVIVWRALSVAGRDAWRGPSLALAGVVVVAVAYVLVASASADTATGWLSLVDQASVAVGAVALSALAAGVVRATAGERQLLGVIVAAAVGTGLALFARNAQLAPAVGWAVLVGGTLRWAVETVVMSRDEAAGVRRHGVTRERQTVGGTLTELSDALAGADVRAACTVGDVCVVIRADVSGGAPRLEANPASQELSALLAMLAVEGGVLPRPLRMDGEEDPLDGAAERLGVRAAMPLTSAQGPAASNVVVLAMGEHDEGFDASAFVEEAEERCGPGFAAEVTAVAAAVVLRAAERAAASMSASASSPGAPADDAPTTETDGALPASIEREPGEADTRWERHLSDEVARRHPVDDPDALNDAEWRALAFLRDSSEPALIVGEAGVGKEFVARAVHAAMWGDSRRFATVDAAQLPASIVMLELFGDGDDAGLVDVVGDGTLLIKSASALGDQLASVVARLRKTPARIVFAERYRGAETGIPTSIPAPIREAAQGRNLHLSPLRDRPDDVIRYARAFMHRAAMRYGALVTEIDDDAAAWLRQHDFAANLRELDALVGAAVLRATGDALSVENLAAGAVAAANDEPDLELTDEEVEERDQIVAALAAEDGNKTRAARRLEMTRGSFLRRLKKYGLDDGDAD